MRASANKRFSRIVIIGWLLAGVLLGLYLARHQSWLSWHWLAFVPIMSFIVVKKRLAALVAALGIGLILGSVRGGMFYTNVAGYDAYFGKRITVVGTVVDDISYDERRQTEFHIGNVIIEGMKLPGRLRVRGFGANDVSRGDVVQVTGAFNRTLGTSRQGSITFAEIEVIGKNTSAVEKTRNKFFASVYSSLPEPQASLGLGFLVGVRTALPEDFSEKLALVGLTHIIAVSGYNMTILVQVVRRLFAKNQRINQYFSHSY